MRILILFLLIPSVLLAQFYSPSYSAAVSKNNLIADYDFSNSSSYAGSGTTVNNLTGKNLPATLSGTIVHLADPGHVRILNSNSNYMMMGDFKSFYPPVTSSTRSGVFTISLWVNLKAANGVILADLNSTVVAGGYHTTDIEMVGGYMKFSVWPRTTYITTASTVSQNVWHHVVLTYTGNQVRAYLDNALVGTATYNRNGPHMGSLTDSQYFALGAYDSVTNMGSGIYGSFLLADVKFYASAFGDADVNSLYQQEKTNYDLAFFIDPGNSNSYAGSGATLYDISGAGKTATNSSTANVAYNVAASGCLYYNAYGLTDFSFDLNGATTLTVEMWVYPVNLTNGMFFGFYTYDIYANNGALGYNTSAGDVYGLNSTQTSGFVNTWRHYVFVMNSGSVTSNKIYVNGVQQSLAQILGTPSNANTSFNNGVGRIASWTINSNYLQQMYMTKFKIYRRELTQAEITAKFNKDKARHGY
jgi:hypothetical protein